MPVDRDGTSASGDLTADEMLAQSVQVLLSVINALSEQLDENKRLRDRLLEIEGAQRSTYPQDEGD